MELPQIYPITGMSVDYLGEYSSKISIFISGEGLEKVANFFRKFPAKRYEERFPQSKYPDVINEVNREKVKRLDELSEIANSRFTDASKFSEGDFKKFINEIYKIIWNTTMFPEKGID
jgi:transcription initiation factor IIF auxiliary subunit